MLSMSDHSRGGKFDELLEQCDPPVQVGAETDLRDDPVLVLGEATQEHVQVGSGATRLFAARHVVQDLVLSVGTGTVTWYRVSYCRSAQARSRDTGARTVGRNRHGHVIQRLALSVGTGMVTWYKV